MAAENTLYSWVLVSWYNYLSLFSNYEKRVCFDTHPHPLPPPPTMSSQYERLMVIIQQLKFPHGKTPFVPWQWINDFKMALMCVSLLNGVAQPFRKFYALNPKNVVRPERKNLMTAKGHWD